MARRIAVVGASMGGLRAAEQLRSAGWQEEITVIGGEAHPPYNRPPLTKELLKSPGSFQEALATVTLRQRRSAADIEWKLGAPVTGADLTARTLTLSTGEQIGYDGLVVATGLRPARVRVPGPLHGRHVIRTLEDALGLHRDLQPGARIVVVGAGFIGGEAAATATMMGCRVTLIEGSSGPMQLTLGRELSEGMRNFLTDRGIECLSGERVAAFTWQGDGTDGPQRCTGVRLTGGREVPADAVIEAVGSKPNVEWLAGNGLDLTDGVLCDGHLRVLGTEHVVAVGDVARYPDRRAGTGPRRVEHWATPADTAKIASPALVAGLNGTPAAEPAAPLPSFWTDIFGIRVQGVGSPAVADRIEVLEGDPSRPAEGVAVAYYLGGRLIGAVTSALPADRQLHYRKLVTDAGLPAGSQLAAV
ncbi:NAD(P)/FAD-dependent oxidoreductase [Arthrobacter sp. CAU 1506]|uniref:NAD(P)/FAD-dependent oxidoreductase n=1 Tax=Arthrobacter sp. CAU 1506 TaxID=2560052 RepID=UPI0010AD58F9|nr:FAD/NAD(P)-binding oxidoreductase [Arthrobacter sp. CAU 1506]TJY72563.1 NAD(P)/FAD-dependent oxidoreductase [Arthrobacter sp. CAU 1506]